MTMKELIKLFEKKYNDFYYNVSINESFINMRTKEGDFINKLLYSNNHMDDYFYRYEYLIQEFTSLGPFTEEYKNQSLQVQKYIQKFITEQVSKIDNIINTIKNNIKYSWVHIKNVINTSIKDTLDVEFTRILEDLKPLNETDKKFSIITENLTPINVKNKYDEILFTINFKTLVNNLLYGYSINPILENNHYNFKINAYTKGNLNVSISTDISNFYQGELKGILGSGTIGISPYYYLEDQSVEIKGFVQSEHSKYFTLYQHFDFDKLQFENDLEKEIDVPSKQNFTINKIFRNKDY